MTEGDQQQAKQYGTGDKKDHRGVIQIVFVFVFLYVSEISGFNTAGEDHV
jgi:hypothetical protein